MNMIHKHLGIFNNLSSKLDLYTIYYRINGRIQYKVNPGYCPDFDKSIIISKDLHHGCSKHRKSNKDSSRKCPAYNTKAVGIPQNHCFCHLPIGIGLKNSEQNSKCYNCKQKVYFHKNIPFRVWNRKHNIVSIVTCLTDDDLIKGKYQKLKGAQKNEESTFTEYKKKNIKSIFPSTKILGKRKHEHFKSAEINAEVNERASIIRKSDLPKLFCKCPCPFEKLS